MCGVTGFWAPGGRVSPSELEGIASRMADTLAHRGPDDHGVWVDAGAGVALAHRRLSIIDLSPEGHQPMVSVRGRHVISYNGEVYNFEEMRRELEPLGHSFRGHSDTEVILAAFAEWGIARAVGRFIGMFAIALWDREEKTLYLIRDRLGKKPMFHGWAGGAFVFGSEMKAVCAHPDFPRDLNEKNLPLFFHFGYIPAPYSVYRGMNVLPPGCILKLDEEGFSAREPKIESYWSLREVVERGAANRFDGTEDEAADELDRLLRDSVRLRMVSDVPIGALLSGGIDSSLVVSLMQAQSARKVHTFSIGFHEERFNEAVFAGKVAAHLGTEHTEMYVTPAEALGVIPEMPEIYDEPFADSSQIPTLLVSRLTRRHVTVALSGDGGDELFCGYKRFTEGNAVWNFRRRLPVFTRGALAGALFRLGDTNADRLLRHALPLLHRMGKRVPNVEFSLKRWSKLLGAAGFDEMYDARLSMYPDLSELLVSSAEPATVTTDPAKKISLAAPMERAMYFDTAQYLPDDILTKVDRASMAVSLEARTPLLDHRVVEFAWRLPLEMKLSGERTKLPLRRVLARYVPESLTERPKCGFAIPVDEWLRGPLREWADELMAPGGIRADGIFRPETALRMWREHAAGEFNHHPSLWTLLMFQAWRKRWLP